MKLVYLVFASVLLAGCGSDEFQDLRDFVKNAGVDMRGKIPPPPEVKLYEPFAYNNEANMPDPFKLRKPEVRSASHRGANEPDLERPKTECVAQLHHTRSLILGRNVPTHAGAVNRERVRLAAEQHAHRL